MRDKECAIKDQRSSISVESYHSTEVEMILTKVITINEIDRMIFARFNSYIMIPWFTISQILHVVDEEKIRTIVKDLWKRIHREIYFCLFRHINLVLNPF